jgi:hypothetical protein
LDAGKEKHWRLSGSVSYLQFLWDAKEEYRRVFRTTVISKSYYHPTPAKTLELIVYVQYQQQLKYTIFFIILVKIWFTAVPAVL